MGKVLEFDSRRVSPIFASQQEGGVAESERAVKDACDLMAQASALLHHGEDVDREVAWLLEDLVDFLQSGERQERESSGQYCAGPMSTGPLSVGPLSAGSLAEVIPFD